MSTGSSRLAFLCFTDIQLKALVLPSGASGSFAQQFFATGSEHPHFDLTLHLQSGLEGYPKTSGWKILNGRVSAAWACSVYAQSCKTVRSNGHSNSDTEECHRPCRGLLRSYRRTTPAR